MPYSDKDKQREAQRRSMAKARDVKPDDVKPQKTTPCETPDVKPCNPSDWSDRRNYTDAYLRCLEGQGYELTEASQVAMRSHRVTDVAWLRRHAINSEVRPAREMTGAELREKLGKVCQALDREMSTLDGQKVNLQTMVRFGVEGPPIDVVSQWLSGRSD